MRIQSGEFFSRSEITLDLSQLNEEKYSINRFNTIYAIAVPVDGDTNSFSVKTMNYVFEVEESTDTVIKHSWPQIFDNIYDVSDLLGNIEGITTQVLLENKVIARFYPNNKMIHLVPFDLEDNKLFEDKSVSFEYQASRGEYKSEMIASGTNLLYSAESIFQNTMAYKIFDQDLKVIHQESLIEQPSNSYTLHDINRNRFITISQTEGLVFSETSYDDSRQSNIMYTLDDSPNGEICAVNAASTGNNGMAFTGLTYPEGSTETKICYGFLDNEGGVVKKLIKEELECIEFSNGLVVHDAIPLKGKEDEINGKIIVLNADSLTEKEIITVSKEECYGRIFVSTSGRYIITHKLGNEVFTLS